MRSFLVAVILILAITSCNRDRKKETISNYIRIIWKIRSEEEFTLTKVEEIKSIAGKDSLEILMREYSKGTDRVLPLDTIFANIEKDLAYNSNLLNKTTRRIDSLNATKNRVPDNPFYSEYIKSFVDLKDFTTSQLDELKLQKYLLTRYHKNEDEIFCHQVLCRYKIKGHSSDTISKVVTQTFFMSPDTKKIYVVK